MKRIFLLVLVFSVFITSPKLLAQKNEIKWMTFDQLEDSLALKPKKVFINFYADWCVYCKKMDEAAYKNIEIIKILTTEYYAVKMNVESRDTIIFDGQAYKNTAYGKKRNPVHEIPLLVASREGIAFSLPAIIILDEDFQITKRYFEYLSPRRMLSLLEN